VPSSIHIARVNVGKKLSKSRLNIASDQIDRVLKWHYASPEPDDRGINASRGYACEIVAWRFLTHLSEHELIDYLLVELPAPEPKTSPDPKTPTTSRNPRAAPQPPQTPTERTQLISRARGTFTERIVTPKTPHFPESIMSALSLDEDEDPTLPFVGHNTLEIAAIGGAKKFMSQVTVQRLVNAIWNGDIIFWDSLNVYATKKPQVYNKR
jgi:hypothetical protein